MKRRHLILFLIFCLVFLSCTLPSSSPASTETPSPVPTMDIPVTGIHREETGYAAGKLFFLTRGPLSSGLSSEMLDVFVATDLSFAGIGNRDETEDIDIMKIPLDRLTPELDRLEKAGNVIDLKAFGLVELAKNSLKNANS